MPLTRKFRPRRLLFRRKRRLPTRKYVANVARRVMTRVTETKCYSNLTPSASFAGDVIYHINPIDQGDADSNRTGLIVNNKRLQMKACVYADAAIPACFVRCLLVKYKQCNGTAPTLADILPLSAATQTDISVELPYSSGKLSQERKRFQILYDRTKFLATATVDSNQCVAWFKYNKILKDKSVFTGANGTDEGNNHYYLILTTDNEDEDLNLVYTTRIFFQDP